MTSLIFPSLTREGIAYEIHSAGDYYDSGFFRNPPRFLHDRFVEFQTYGNGLVQHSNSLTVSVDCFVDALASLAKHLFDHPEAVQEVEKFWPEDNTRFDKRIQFFSSLKYDEEKTRYYNESEMKVSASEKKAHDRRWEAVPSWADGRIEAVFRFTAQSHWGALERYNLYQRLRETLWWENIEGSGIGSTERTGDLNYAFDSVDFLVKSHRNMEAAKSCFDCLNHNWISHRVKREEIKEEVEAEV